MERWLYEIELGYRIYRDERHDVIIWKGKIFVRQETGSHDQHA